MPQLFHGKKYEKIFSGKIFFVKLWHFIIDFWPKFEKKYVQQHFFSFELQTLTEITQNSNTIITKSLGHALFWVLHFWCWSNYLLVSKVFLGPFY